ncbi:flagellar protein export ATPase FliI [Paradevosia shaoguanensis]|uniref:Flagellum-specific ATP synthase n=1 Tax=Paradevosia shaoguanensis TaxID=1335043 RepID=A0AA41QRV9_9HYPH|nr:flagellar protein export ATPase FliI [Paradevosia shaoguanensis]KFL28901.1 ATP synthase [Devosia sp. 17-2-E-8]MCF1744391.1 flagellar protein export ATPase FliI [Paradevosia shaoguanensis]MCI0128874.1 flagellar protein export ATPase FliI [Paradevosia shaoguanensis]QMV00825.1 flagellar protein export ATPase FliI [Devosia sp. D6-9]
MKSLTTAIDAIDEVEVFGRVKTVQGLLIEIVGPVRELRVGGRVSIETQAGEYLPAEIIGFREGHALCLPFGPLAGVRLGCKAVFQSSDGAVYPSPAWLGRVINAVGEPIDGKGPIAAGASAYPLRQNPLAAHDRVRVGAPIDLGVRVLNTFTTICDGQRMGIFAGSGVGKSVLMSMLARNTDADVAVIGLIGERGREVHEFISEYLGEEGLQRAVVVVATSDEAALMRRQAAYLTLSLSEYFRDQGQRVLCMMDSLTRFAMAQREIGLAIGEPPTAKGYPPTVFTELPRLLERAGPGTPSTGSITGLFTVLVEGDDHNEPIADAVRGILDGHIVMERGIAERGRYPAVNVLRSISRTMPGCVPVDMRPTLSKARELMSVYADMEELIRLGAYRKGSDPKVDRAIAINPALEAFLSQQREERTSIADGYNMLAAIVDMAEAQQTG